MSPGTPSGVSFLRINGNTYLEYAGSRAGEFVSKGMLQEGL